MLANDDSTYSEKNAGIESGSRHTDLHKLIIQLVIDLHSLHTAASLVAAAAADEGMVAGAERFFML